MANVRDKIPLWKEINFEYEAFVQLLSIFMKDKQEEIRQEEMVKQVIYFNESPGKFWFFFFCVCPIFQNLFFNEFFLQKYYIKL